MVKIIEVIARLYMHHHLRDSYELSQRSNQYAVCLQLIARQFALSEVVMRVLLI